MLSLLLSQRIIKIKKLFLMKFKSVTLSVTLETEYQRRMSTFYYTSTKRDKKIPVLVMYDISLEFYIY